MDADLSVVLAALDDSGADPVAAVCPPQSERRMLKDTLPHAVAPFAQAEEPHAFQRQVVDAARAALAETRTALEGHDRDAGAGIDAAQREVAEAEAVVSAAAGAVEAAGKAAEASAARLAERRAAAAQEEQRHREAEEATRPIIEAKTQLEERREETRRAADALEAGDAEAVAAFLAARRSEKPLLAALPGALGTPPGDRRDFDAVVVQEASRLLAEALAEVEAELATSAQDAAYAEAELLGSWALLDTAKDARLAAEKDLKKAEASLRDMEAELKLARVAAAGRKEALSAKVSGRELLLPRAEAAAAAIAALERLCCAKG